MSENNCLNAEKNPFHELKNTNQDFSVTSDFCKVKLEVLENEKVGQINEPSSEETEIKCDEVIKQEEIEIKTLWGNNTDDQKPNNHQISKEKWVTGISSMEDDVFKLCNQCNYKTKHNHCLNRHLIKIHEHAGEEKVKFEIFSCSHCSFQTNNETSFLCHEKTHKNKIEMTLFRCDFCLFSSKHKSGILKHIKCLHGDQLTAEKLYKCQKCSFETMWRNDLRKHKKLHLNPGEIETYKCFECSFETGYKDSLKQHVLIHRNPEELPMFKCEHCSYISRWKNSLTKHVKIHSNPKQDKDYKCNYCSYQTVWLSALKKHVRNKHTNPKEEHEYKCVLCDFTSTNIRNFKSHQKSHSNPEKKTFSCPECNFTSFYKYSIKEHIMMKHQNLDEANLFGCEFCPYRSKSQITLERHKKTHKKHELSIGTDNLPTFSCDYCLYETKWKHELNQHLKLHAEIMDKGPFYYCPECTFKTAHKPNLRYHSLQNHLPDVKMATFKCEFCPYVSLYRGNLEKHLKNCTKYLGRAPQGKLFHCRCCSFETNFKKSLKIHEKRHIFYEIC